jgi:hypothetical protein
MEDKKKKFVNDLKAKIQQKLKGRETEESFLMKTFKFMDVAGSGQINFDQFFEGIGRLGFALEKAVTLLFIYRNYMNTSLLTIMTMMD